MNEFSILAFGGNADADAGSPLQTMLAALQQLPKHGLNVLSVSRFYNSPAFPVGSGPDYVNGALLVSSNHPAQDVLNILHCIEAEFGRERVTRWGARTLDLDLIDHNGLISPNEEVQTYWRTLDIDRQKNLAPDQLILPHPRVQDRAFVLIPMAEVVPKWIHPVTGATIHELISTLPKVAKDELTVIEGVTFSADD